MYSCRIPAYLLRETVTHANNALRPRQGGEAAPKIKSADRKEDRASTLLFCRERQKGSHSSCPSTRVTRCVHHLHQRTRNQHTSRAPSVNPGAGLEHLTPSSVATRWSIGLAQPPVESHPQPEGLPRLAKPVLDRIKGAVII